jgi:Putative peptidoglycan binding domain
MSTVHTVEQGEHLSGIAAEFGFANYRTLWDHPQNAALKQKRQDPNVIFPGDQLFIPDKGEKTEARSTEKRHHFKLKRQPLKLRLILEDLYEKPIANAKVELGVEGAKLELTTDKQGKLEREINPTDKQASLTIKDPQTPISGILIPIKIGHLDPVDELSGQKARLNNLGYLAGPIEGRSEEDNNLIFHSAIEEFQCEHSLTVDGKCGPMTQSKLKQVHGC